MKIEKSLLETLKDKKTIRKDIVPLYAQLIYFNDLVDWKKINKAIMSKWSRNGLVYIKKLAWKSLDKSINQNKKKE